jgi:hypothetical protein
MPALRIGCGYDSIRGRIIRFLTMIFAPLVFRFVQNREFDPASAEA